MTQAIELNSVRRGYDPREFTLVAAGGAGPLFACDIALELEIPRVLVPPHPGIVAATGLLATDLQHEFVATERHAAEERSTRRGSRPATTSSSRRRSPSSTSDGVPEDRRLVRRLADCRYAGQGYEVRFDVAGRSDRRRPGSRRSRMRSTGAHEAEYGHRFDAQIEIINIRARRDRARRRAPADRARAGRRRPVARQDARARGRLRRRRHGPSALDARSTSASSCAPATASSGPAIIEQYDSTTVVPPGLTAEIDRYGNIVDRLRASGSATDAAARRRARDADPDARDRRRLHLDREGDGRRPLPHVVLVDHPRVRGPRRRASSTATATSSPSPTRRRCSWARCRRSSRT